MEITASFLQRIISCIGNTKLQIIETEAAASVLDWYVPLATLTWCLTTKIPFPTYGQGYVLYL